MRYNIFRYLVYRFIIFIYQVYSFEHLEIISVAAWTPPDQRTMNIVRRWTLQFIRFEGNVFVIINGQIKHLTRQHFFFSLIENTWKYQKYQIETIHNVLVLYRSYYVFYKRHQNIFNANHRNISLNICICYWKSLIELNFLRKRIIPSYEPKFNKNSMMIWFSSWILGSPHSSFEYMELVVTNKFHLYVLYFLPHLCFVLPFDSPMFHFC